MGLVDRPGVGLAGLEAADVSARDFLSGVAMFVLCVLALCEAVAYQRICEQEKWLRQERCKLADAVARIEDIVREK